MSAVSEPISFAPDEHRSGKSAAALSLRYALRELRGGLRGFYVVIACIALGVMAIAGVGSVAASSSASRSHARWRRTPQSWSPTNRPAISMRRRASKSSTCSLASMPSAA